MIELHLENTIIAFDGRVIEAPDYKGIWDFYR
jgi:hypothetical protein